MNSLWLIARMIGSRRARGIPFTRLTIGGVALGVAILVMTLSIIDGFADAYRDGLVRFHAPVLILREDERVDPAAVEKAIATLRAEDSLDVASVRRATRLREWWWWGTWKYSEWTWPLRRVPGLDALIDALHPRYLVERLTLPESFVAWREQWHADVRCHATHGITAAGPFLYREGLAIGNGVIRGVALRGVRPEQMAQLQTLKVRSLTEVTDVMQALRQSGEAIPLLLGSAVAAQIGTTEISLFLPKSRANASTAPHPARVVGIFESGIYEFDSQFAFVDLARLQSLYGLTDVVSGYEIQIAHLDQAGWIADALRMALGPEYTLQDWRELHRETFEAVALEKILFGLIMGILVLIACANIVTAMLLRILLQYRSVAILHAIGMTARQSRRIYFWQGFTLGMCGVLGGVALGSSLAWLLGRFEWISIAPEIYFLSHVPVALSASTLISIALFGTVVVTLAASRAARRVTQLPILQALGRGYL